jgi:hypothetical protein
VGRSEPKRLRLLRPRHVRVRPGGHLASALHRRPVQLPELRLRTPERPPARRPRLLRRPGARRDLRRQRAVHPRAAHG